MIDSRIQISTDPIDLNFLNLALYVADHSTDLRLNKKTGCLIIIENKIVGTGSRKTVVIQENPYKDITYHAEHVALMEAKEKAKGATLFTVMEPCFSRSFSLINAWEPANPCCQLVFEAGIKRVVFGIFDENFGAGGAKYLLDRGIEVSICEVDKSKFGLNENAITYKTAK